MKKILITGSTGNVGMAVLRYLQKLNAKDAIVVGIRSVKKQDELSKKFPHLSFVLFDFEKDSTFLDAFSGVTTVFLLRPPHISNIPTYFAPLISSMKRAGVQEVVFLSVQGVERSKIIPHNKIEQLIKESGMSYIFLRPGYFMQNLTTTLSQDIQVRKQINLPAGKAKFVWVDVDNIGEVAAHVLTHFDAHRNQPLEITGTETEDFYTISEKINRLCKTAVTYQSVSPFRFYRLKKKDGMNRGMIMVMIMLHFLPRFQKSPSLSSVYQQLTSKQPTTLDEFIKREQHLFKK